VNDSLKQAALRVLTTANPTEKCAAAHDLSSKWKQGSLAISSDDSSSPDLPDMPSRPDAPIMVSPFQVKRRGLGTERGRASLLHAIAHIEFNAIDLAADMLARFACSPLIPMDMREDFISDWISVCDDEARHFALVIARMSTLCMQYGDLPAHDGLWQAAEATKDDFIARLVIAPMVLEARGLDVTPTMIEKLTQAGDTLSAAVLQTIYDDEIGHVAIGSHWFHTLCAMQNLPPQATFQNKVSRYFKGLLKPPFNRPARDMAGLPHCYYAPTNPA